MGLPFARFSPNTAEDVQPGCLEKKDVLEKLVRAWGNAKQPGGHEQVVNFNEQSK